jgi:hypothetical protein
MKIVLVLLLTMALAACGDLERALTPPLEMRVELRAPAGGEVSLSISGSGLNQVYTDNGQGLTTTVTIWPGSYTATLSPLSIGPIHYQGMLAFTNANGNVTRANSIDFQVRDTDKRTLRLAGSYRATTGSLRVSATGLPFGSLPRLYVRNVAGVEVPFNPAEPIGLAPGSYQVRFKPVVVDGRTHNPTPETVVVAVEAGVFAAVSVAYAEVR